MGRQLALAAGKLTQDGNSLSSVHECQVGNDPVRFAVRITPSGPRRIDVAYELTAYAPLVRTGGWLIVEDTNHQIIQRDYVGENCGPADVLPWFLDGHPEFIADRLAERYLLTFNPGGYLRRVA